MGEFVRYHNGCDGECNGILLTAWADLKETPEADRFDLAFFYATVYNIPSAIFMLNERDGIVSDPDGWCKNNKCRLIFQSDRRYMRCNGSLEKTLRYFAENLAGGSEYTKATVTDGLIRTDMAVRTCQEWPNFGRFGAYLFTETLTYLLHLESANAPRFDFRNGATATSGLMNVFGFDREAEEFDRRKRIPESMSLEQLDVLLAMIAEAVEESGGNADYSCLETSLCAYRKFFKGSRYNGFYLDRQLGELYRYPTMNEGSIGYVNELFDLRSELFPHWMLGEFRNWDGIRKHMKTFYRRNGRVNGRGDG